MSELTGTNPLGAIAGGALVTVGGLGLAKEVLRVGPGVSGNLAPALLVGAAGGLAGHVLSSALGDNLLSDIAVTAGMAGMGALIMSSGGRAGIVDDRGP